MSIKMMLAAMQVKTGSPVTKLVLLKLADNASDKGECWPSHETIADVCEMSVKTSQRHIAKLEAMGLLKIFRQPKSSGGFKNIYYLKIENAMASNSPSEETIATISPIKQQSIATISPNHSDYESPSMASNSRPNLSIEPINESVNLKATHNTGSVTLFDQKFERFWKLYPNKSDKKKSQVKFEKLNLNDFQFSELMQGLENQIEWREQAPQGAFVPQWKLPTTWLNGENWEDELTPWAKSSNSSFGKHGQAAMDMMNKMEFN